MSDRHARSDPFRAYRALDRLGRQAGESQRAGERGRRTALLAASVMLSGTLLFACASRATKAATPAEPRETSTGPARLQVGSPTPEPFLLSLPTPGPEPISGWRPPLYPIPWALSPHDHFYFARPIAADQVNWPLANYRYGGVFFAPNIVHTGVDIPAPEGIPIMAAGPGQVVWTGWGLFTESPGLESDPYGLAVAIRHDFGYKGQQLYSVYAHMSRVDAVLGQQVETGDLVGLVGATGETTGPHLHFEVRLADNSFHATYNPELWIVPPQGWGVLVAQVNDSRGLPLNQLDVHVRSDSTGEARMVRTYGGDPVNRDPYYDENLVLGDLPAGLYKITLVFDGK